MSKERLEEYKKRLWDIAEGLASYSGVKLSDKEKEIVNYFIEQAEQVEGLEAEVTRLKELLTKDGYRHLENQYNGLLVKYGNVLRENNRYREAIEKSIKDLEEDISIVDCARNAHYRLSKTLEGEE